MSQAQSQPSATRTLIQAILLAAVLAPIQAITFTSPAFANYTGAACDSDPKYYCISVWYADNGSWVTIQERWSNGAINGGAQQWQRFITSDWYRDPNTGIWYNLGNWPAGVWRTNVSLGTYDNVVFYRDVEDEAWVQMRTRFYEFVSGFGWYYWCGDGIDWRLEGGVGPSRWGGRDC